MVPLLPWALPYLCRLLLNLCSPCGSRNGPWQFPAFNLPAEGAAQLLGNSAEPHRTHDSEQNQHYPTRLSKGGVLFISDFFFCIIFYFEVFCLKLFFTCILRLWCLSTRCAQVSTWLASTWFPSWLPRGGCCRLSGDQTYIPCFSPKVLVMG